jgi:sugar-specific transcriptional regulator TrmB
MLDKILHELNLPLQAQKIFTSLLEKGPSTARLVAERLGIPRPSVYDNIKILIQHGLVSERDEENKKIFSVDDVHNIPNLLQSKIDSLETEKASFKKLLPTLLKQTSFTEPKIKFYSGKEGLQQVMNHIMWHRNINTTIMWPMSEVLNVLGADYLEELNKKRIKRNISIRGIYPHGSKQDFKKYPFLGVGGGHLREIRLAPKDMAWDMGYWMYEDKVAFISSQKESFGFIIHSRDFANLMKTQFEAIWDLSKPVKAEPQYTDAFLEGLDSETK